MTTTTISSGQTVSGATVSVGDTEIVLSGGSSVDPGVTGGMLTLQGGTAISAGVAVGGTISISSGGQALSTTISGASGFVRAAAS